MSAPLAFFSGALAAQMGCATGGPDTTYITQRRKARHCAFASGAAQQAGFHTPYQVFRAGGNQSRMEDQMTDAVKMIAMKILGDHLRSIRLRDPKTGRMVKTGKAQ